MDAEQETKRWRIRFRYITPYDYTTPLFHIPIESTIIEAETAEQAWKQFINSTHASSLSRYQKESIEEE